MATTMMVEKNIAHELQTRITHVLYMGIIW